MSNTRVLLAALIAAAAPTCLAAPEPAAPPVPATLADALATALDGRAEMRAAGLQTDAARERVREAAARFYPSVDFLLTAQRTRNYDTYSGITVSANVGGQTAVMNVARSAPGYSLTPTLQLGYDLYMGGRDAAGVRKAEALRSSAALHAEVVAHKIMREVTVDYLRLGQAFARWRNARARADVAAVHADAVRLRLGEGRASQLDERSAALDKAKRDLDVRVAEQDLAKAYADYAAAAGGRLPAADISPDAVAPLVAGLEKEIERLERQASGDADVEPDVARARAEAKAGREDVVVERAAFRPQVSLFAQYAGVGRSDAAIGSAWSDTRRANFALGATVSVNFFAGFANSARMSQAQLNARRSEEEADALETQFALARYKLRQEVKRAQEQERYARERKDVAALQLQVTEAKVASGRAPSDDVTQARGDLDAIDTDILDSRIDAAIARVKLQFLSSEDGKQ